MAKAKYTVTITPFDNFGGRSKVRFGVGEELKIDVKEEPAAKPPTAMVWSVKSGPASVHNTNPPGAGTVQCGNVAGTVVLELHNASDKSLLANKRFEVVAPTGATMEKVRDLPVTHGAGFEAKIFLLPNDVSFKWVEMREGEAPYEGNGCFAKAQVKVAEVADEFAVIHPVMGEWAKCKGGGSKGTEVVNHDTVTSAIPANIGTGGTFSWHIPWYYRVHGVSGEFRFLTATHKEVVDATGKMAISKLDVSVPKQL
jgi:hypothetical protein